MMRYVSTRGGTDPLTFQDAVLTGLAPDGGLLVPKSIPDVTGELASLEGLGFVELAKAIVPRFVDDIPEAVLCRLIDDAYESFDLDDVVRLQSVDPRWELILALEFYSGTAG